jgi:hypothetical protein
MYLTAYLLLKIPRKIKTKERKKKFEQIIFIFGIMKKLELKHFDKRRYWLSYAQNLLKQQLI